MWLCYIIAYNNHSKINEKIVQISYDIMIMIYGTENKKSYRKNLDHSIFLASSREVRGIV